jgi:hypothetical protein
MSKSTPISQLPSNAMNTNNDIMMDEDPTVQEVLSQFEQPTQPQIDMNQFNQQQQMQQRVINNANVGNNMSQQPMMPPQAMFQNSFTNPSDFVMQPPSFNVGSLALNNKSFFNFDGDIKNILLVVALTFIVQVAPFETFVFKYAPIENIPYSSFIIKAVVAGIAFFFLQRYI